MSAVQIRLREIRKERGLTQVQLAELCGMPQSTISRIESGSTTGVDFETLDRIADALGVHPSELISYDKIPFEYRGRSHVLTDTTAEAAASPGAVRPPTANARWSIDQGGRRMSFWSEPNDSPGDLIKRAKRILGAGRRKG